jgi:hypothetical protein
LIERHLAPSSVPLGSLAKCFNFWQQVCPYNFFASLRFNLLIEVICPMPSSLRQTRSTRYSALNHSHFCFFQMFDYPPHICVTLYKTDANHQEDTLAPARFQYSNGFPMQKLFSGASPPKWVQNHMANFLTLPKTQNIFYFYCANAVKLLNREKKFVLFVGAQCIAPLHLILPIIL